jgi:serine-type D-Ala-D-Ala carboxypeptidase/endopeptidase (penicillin-binding protein 4)
VLAIVAVAAVLILTGAGLAVTRPWNSAVPAAVAQPAASAAAAPPAPVLADESAGAPMPGSQEVAALLSPLLTDPHLGTHVTANVVDVASGTDLYGRNPTSAATPASTMKLVTSAAILQQRGPEYRIPTTAVAGANPGEVVIVGGGDPTLAGTGTPGYAGAARLSDLASQVKKALGGTAPTRVLVDSSLFTGPAVNPGWKPSDVGGNVPPITALMTDGGRVRPRDPGAAQRVPQPDMYAGQQFARLLGLPPTAVARGRAPAGGDSAAAPSGTVAPGTQLGVVKSLPLGRMVETMLSTSDNVVAEMLNRQVAIAAGQPASFTGGSAAVTSTLAALGVPTFHVHIVDGSGLAKANTLTTDLLTAVLTVASKPEHAGLRALFSGLPVAGYSGTLTNRYVTKEGTAAGAGLVRAKTGTLTGVSSLAGMVVTASGRLLVFAVIADEVTTGVGPAEVALDKMAVALVGLT